MVANVIVKHSVYFQCKLYFIWILLSVPVSFVTVLLRNCYNHRLIPDCYELKLLN